MIRAEHILDPVLVDDDFTLLHKSPGLDRTSATAVKMVVDDEERAGAVFPTAGNGS